MKQKKKILAGTILVVCTLVLTLLLKSAQLFEQTESNLSALLYQERAISEDIVIVAIDSKSLSAPEEGGLDGFQAWTRKYYADVLSKVEESNAKTVFFDVLFSSASNGAEGNELISTLKASTDATDFSQRIMAYANEPHPNDQYFSDILSQYDNVYIVKSSSGATDWNGESFDVEKETLPLDMFTESAKVGFAKVIDNEDSQNSSLVFAIPTLLNVNGVHEKHVDLQIAEAFNEKISEVPTEKGQMLINYAGKSYTYPSVSFSDVYYNQVPSSTFDNKIVLIGATASILQDRHFTPLDQVRPTPGVEIHANAIQTILDEAYLQHESTVEFTIILSLLVIMSVFVFLFAPIWAGAAFLATEIVLYPWYSEWRFSHGTIVNLIWPVFAIVLSFLATLAYRNFTEFAEKRKLKTAFSRYVSPELAEQITEKPELLKLGGDRRNITALFLDIENFTNLSEGLEPQEVVSIINQYFDALAQVIMSHGGSVDKYEGDAIMALFGAPLPSESHAENACLAALAIQARISELNAQLGYKLNIRVGLSTGDAIVGNMGSSQRFDYTAMGDTVNTASRLEGANKFYKTRILVNPGTEASARSKIFFRKVDTVQLKGKDNAIQIYEVLGTLEGASPDGKALIDLWHTALSHYQKAEWTEAAEKIHQVLERLPDDGPAKTLLARIEELKMLPREGWDGVWKFDSK